MAALAFLTPYFYYIPKASLAAVIIVASFMMVDVKMVKYIYKSKSTYARVFYVICFQIYFNINVSVPTLMLDNIGTNAE